MGWPRGGGSSAVGLNVNKHTLKSIAAYRKNGFSIRDSVCIEIGCGFVMDDFIMALTIGEE